MIIKKLNFNHYKTIKKFLKNNNSRLPRNRSWISFNNITNKNSSFYMDGLFKNNKIVGYHSVIEKIILFKKKKYKIFVSSNWNVSKKYRRGSFFLINNYFRQKSDLFLTTTANQKASKIWMSLGGIAVNSQSSKIALYQVLNYFKLIKNYFQNKGINFIPNFLIHFIVILINIFFVKKNTHHLTSNLNFKKINKNSLNLENFNKIFEANCSYPLEQRSKFILNRYISSLELNNKKVFVYQIVHQNIMVGYFVLVKEKYRGINRIFFGEVRIFKKYEKKINEILSFANLIAKKNNCTYIYYRNLRPNILKKIDFKNFSISKYDFNPYIIKIGSKKAEKLRKYLQNNWGTSYLDGDCLL